jgi:hypothetical protein
MDAVGWTHAHYNIAMDAARPDPFPGHKSYLGTVRNASIAPLNFSPGRVDLTTPLRVVPPEGVDLTCSLPDKVPEGVDSTCSLPDEVPEGVDLTCSLPAVVPECVDLTFFTAREVLKRVESTISPFRRSPMLLP